VIDLSHSIARQNVLQGALVLGRSARFMPADSVFVAVVDPGVGSDRRAIAVRSGSGVLLVGPDNGLLSIAWRELGGAEAAAEITSPKVLVEPISKTFHGRDIFAPAGAHLAAGLPLEEIGSAIEPSGLEAIELPAPMVTPGKVGARVVGIDGFGNVQLNTKPDDLERAGFVDQITIGSRTIRRVDTFTDVHEGVLAAIVDSQGFVALVVNRGNASEVLQLAPGDAVVLET
jgi:S-adenosylmethionine hydrolase